MWASLVYLGVPEKVITLDKADYAVFIKTKEEFYSLTTLNKM